MGQTRFVSGPVTLSARAKLTLSLRITGVREDGYHLLDSEMVSLDLADTLEISGGEGLTVVDDLIGGGGIAQVPLGAQNIVSRALELTGRSAHVRIVKRIPPGAGLGGGSADAAAVLRWAGFTEPALASRLGADVPFCMVGGRARVTGIGENVEPLPYEDRSFLLLLPPLSVSTAEVYRRWDERRSASGAARPVPDPDLSAPPGFNDLEEAAVDVEPGLAEWRDRFREATGSRPRLAGSGAAWFVEISQDAPIQEPSSLRVGPQRAPIVVARAVPSEDR